MAEGAALVESMDWTAGSIIEDGSAEAAGAEDAIVRAVLELPGGGQQREAEDAIEYLWRCGALRGTAYGFSILFDPPRSIAQQGGLSCAACAAAPPTEPLQGPPKA